MLKINLSKTFSVGAHHIVFAMVCVLGVNQAIATESGDPRAMVHIAEPPVLDGKLDDPAWKKAVRFELRYSNVPEHNAPAPVKTLAYVYEDGESLNVALYAYDPQPDKIRAHMVGWDDSWDDDLLGFAIDTFNTQRDVYEFYVNPVGAQMDMRATDNDGWQVDDSWNGLWSAAASRTEDGWSAELSIPFSSLRFPKTTESSGSQVWGISFFRFYPRSFRHWLGNDRSESDRNCAFCGFSKVGGFSRIKPSRNLQVTPVLTFMDHKVRPQYPGPWETEQDGFEPGLDLRWGITQDSVLNATINPDFSQVEADVPQLDVNTAFSLFFPEKRPFFLDGADYFDTDAMVLTHTRNIADPDWGAKYTGQSGRHSYALLAAEDNATTFIVPGNLSSDLAVLTTPEGRDLASSVAIGRYEMDLGGRSTLGLLMNHRRGTDYSNSVASVDGRYWFNRNNSLMYQMAYSDSTNPTFVQQNFDLPDEQQGYAYVLRYAHETQSRLLAARVRSFEPDFRADLGFITEADIREFKLSGGLKYYGDEGDFLAKSNYQVDWTRAESHSGEDLFDEIDAYAIYDGAYQSKTEFGVVRRDRLFDGPYTRAYFIERYLRANTRFWPWESIKLDFEGEYGQKLDLVNGQLGDSFYFGSGILTNIGKHVRFVVNYKYSKLDVDENEFSSGTSTQTLGGGRLFRANQFDFRVYYHFSIRNQIKLIALYTDVDHSPDLYLENHDENSNNDIQKEQRDYTLQLMYSYKINPQTLFYLGGSNGGRYNLQANDLVEDSSAVFAKLRYTFQ